MSEDAVDGDDSCESDDSDFVPKKKKDKKLSAKKPAKLTAKKANTLSSQASKLVNITNIEVKPTGNITLVCFLSA